MLDQNTDRMWYVIGAVVIGGLIITAAILLFKVQGMEMIETAMENLSSRAVDATDQLKNGDILKPVKPDGTINLLSQLTQMPLF